MEIFSRKSTEFFQMEMEGFRRTQTGKFPVWTRWESINSGGGEVRCSVAIRSALRDRDPRGGWLIRVASPSLVEEMADSKVYHFDEVVKHNATKDCWLIIDGKVYDVTPFMDEHPGGDEVLLAATGRDATNDFEDIGHSPWARDMMTKYYIGKIDPSTVSAKRTYVKPQQAPNLPNKSSDPLIKVLQFVVPLLILALAFALRKFTKAD